MKKHLGKISIILLAITLIFAMSACTDTAQQTEDEKEVEVIAIEIDSSTIPTNAVAGGLDLSAIKAKVYLSNDTITTVDLSVDMVSLNDRNKLYAAGQQIITVIYEGCTTKFQIKLTPAPIEKFTLVVEGGELVAINGKTLTEDEKPQIKDGRFSGEYEKGTILTVKWINVEGYEFSHWTDQGSPMETSTTVQITMNGPRYYKAETTALTNLVNFATNGATVTALPPRRTNMLYQSDINNGKELEREDYVFDGWTTTPVDETSSINSTAPKITFPYKVEIETRLYATWRPLGIVYRQQEGEIGYVVTKYELPHLVDKLKAPKILQIPARYQGSNVLGIDADAFSTQEAAMLQTIIIPDTVKYIADGAFRSCSQLVGIDVATTAAFYQTVNGVLFSYGLEKLIAYPSAKMDISYQVPQSTKQIAPYAFKDALLGSVVLSNVISIGSQAFNSSHIDRINFDAVQVNAQTEFGSDLFNTNLRKIIVSPSYLDAYQDLSSFGHQLEKIITSDDNVLLNINPDRTLLFRVVFNENSPNPQLAVEIIGAKRDLTTVTVPDMINRTNVFSVAARAFNYCWYLKDIIFPQDNNLDRIGEDAFAHTPWLENNKQNDSIIINRVLYKYLGQSANYSLPANVIKIAEGAFYGNTKLQSLSMSQNNELVFIGAYAFYNCTELSGDLVVIPKVQTIYKYAFANTKIKKLVLQAGSELKEISDYAFANCYYLTSCQLSYDISIISTTAFMHCYSLEEFVMQTEIAGKTPSFRAYDGILYKCNSSGTANELYTYPAGKMLGVFDINRPSQDVELNITTIGDYALFFSNVASVIIPETITGISSSAFYIPGLVYVEFEKPLSNITYKLLFQDDLVGIGKYEPSYVIFNIDDKENNIPTSQESTDIDIFYGHNVDLKNRVNYYNTNHTEFVYDETNKLLYAFDTINETPRLSIVRSSRIQTEITIPNQAIEFSDGHSYYIRDIDGYAFFGYYISKVTANSIRNIYDYAFSQAKNFKILDVKENANIIFIEENSFNEYFNNGMLVYIMPAYTQDYVDGWTSYTGQRVLDRYLLESGQGIANFIYADGEKWDTIFYFDGMVWKQTSSDTHTEKNAQNTIYANYFPIPTRLGYEFDGWQEETGKRIDLSKDYFIPYNIDLIALWRAKVYTVEFVIANGVQMNTRTIYISYDDKSFNYDMPTYPNKKFDGWRDLDGNIYSVEEGVTPSDWISRFTTDTIKLYPIWKDITYLIKYSMDQSQGETCAEESYIVTLGNTYTLAIPEKLGYVFIGWTLDEIVGESCNLITDAQGRSLDLWTLSTSQEYTVYPCFVPQSYTVTLMIDEDTQYDIVTNVVFGQSFLFEYTADKISDGSLLTKYPVSLFCGWVNIDGQRYADDSGAGAKWNDAQDTTLFALWPEFINSQAEFDDFLLEEDHLSRAIALKTDIVITRPLGNRNNPYTGVFIGNSHTVTLNYSVVDGANYDGYVGMVAHNKGTIKDVKLITNIEIQTCVGYDGDLYLGGVAGINEGRIISTISDTQSDIIVSVFVNFTQSSKNAYIGGIAGKNSGVINNLSCEINTITIELNGQAYTHSEESIKAGCLVGIVESGRVASQRSAKYYYDNDVYILSDYGIVNVDAIATWSATKIKNN